MKSAIERLGYLGLEVSDLPAWVHFATSILGMQADARDDGAVDLRMDSQAWRIRLLPGPRDDLAFAGWEVQDPVALSDLAKRLEAAGVPVAWGDADKASDRQVLSLIRFADPEGNALEAYCGPLQKTHLPFTSPLGVTFRTGRQGLGHIVLSCADPAAVSSFYRDILRFRLSDIVNAQVVPGRPLEMTFLRCNSRHHSLALVAVPLPRKLIHLMVETASIDDVGRAMDRCRAEGIHLSFTLGRHSNDEMISFYPLSPSGFDVEYGFGGLEVDEDCWHVTTHDRISAWGHEFRRPPRPAGEPTR